MHFTLLFVMLLSYNSFSSPESICGLSDDRKFSYDPKVARASHTDRLVGCTVTMIGKSCAISAGHCVNSLDKASFNVPQNIEGVVQSSSPEDIYLRNRDFLHYKDAGRGMDWAVIRLNKNKLTGLYPGEAQGFYNVNFDAELRVGDEVRITGFGVDENDENKTFTQQTHLGKLKRIGSWSRKATLAYEVDTTGGNSGSAIFLERTNEIIGIHAIGGCTPSSGDNKGTHIGKNMDFREVVEQCLAWDKSL